MADLVSVARDDLRARRKQKKRQRSVKWVQGIWRSLALMSVASGAVWLTTRPEWILYSSNQITIEGNQALSPETVRTLIPLDYPQSLLSLKPQRLAQEIEAQGPIAEAIVTRHLLPPSLSIQVQERLPVARSLTPISSQNGDRPLTEGYLDEQGNWLPATAYQNLNNEITMPTLDVTGLREIQRPFWRQMYPVLQRSPVKIISINWQDSNNLILNTEIGSFHLGANLRLLEEQLVAIAKLQTLSQQIPLKNVEYINLANPKEPLIKEKPSSKKPPAPET